MGLFCLGERWCLTIAYDERETRASNVLARASAQPCPCPSGCNGNGKSNGHGCGCGAH